MNHGTTVSFTASPNGDLTLTNPEGSVTIRKDGTIVVSTLAPIELTGETIGKFDGLHDVLESRLFMQALQRRGKKS